MNESYRPETAAHSVDPITLEVIRHGIVSITDQIDANISRTALALTSTSIRISLSGW